MNYDILIVEHDQSWSCMYSDQAEMAIKDICLRINVHLNNAGLGLMQQRRSSTPIQVLRT